MKFLMNLLKFFALSEELYNCILETSKHILLEIACLVDHCRLKFGSFEQTVHSGLKFD